MKKLLASALFLGLAACGGGGGLSAEDAVDSIATEGCAKAFECQDSFPGTEQQFTDFYGANEAACVENIRELLGADEIIASVEAGRIEYNGDDAQACIDGQDLGSVTCEDFWGGNAPEGPPECDTAFVGTVPDDGECTIAEDCATEGAVCDGVCIPPA